jgi:hypothetical protein
MNREAQRLKEEEEAEREKKVRFLLFVCFCLLVRLFVCLFVFKRRKKWIVKRR